MEGKAKARTSPSTEEHVSRVKTAADNVSAKSPKTSYGITLRDACKTLGLSPATFRRLLRQYDGIPGIPRIEEPDPPGSATKKGLVRIDPDTLAVLSKIVRLRQQGKSVDNIKAVLLQETAEGSTETENATVKEYQGARQTKEIPINSETITVAPQSADHGIVRDSCELSDLQTSEPVSQDVHNIDTLDTVFKKPDTWETDAAAANDTPNNALSRPQFESLVSQDTRGIGTTSANLPSTDTATTNTLETTTANTLEETLRAWGLDSVDSAKWKLNFREYGETSNDDLSSHLEHLAKALNRSEERRARDRDRLLTALMRTQQEIQQLRYELVGQRSRRQRKKGLLVRLLG